MGPIAPAAQTGEIPVRRLRPPVRNSRFPEPLPAMRSLLLSVRNLASERGGAGPAILVGGAHGATHWVNATFFVLLPFVAAELGLSYTQTGTLATLLYASAVIANVGSGPLVDLSGRFVGVQAASLLIGGFGLAISSLADSMILLAASVILIGFSISLWHPAAITYLSRRYPSARGLALSIHTVGASLGDMLAPVAAGLLLLVLTWQGTALVSAIPLFAMAVVVVWSLSDSDAPAPGRSAPTGFSSYMQGIGALVRHRALVRLCLIAGLWSMAQGGIQVFVPLYLVGSLDASPAIVGISMMAMQAGGVIGGPLAGAWSDRVGRRRVVLTGLAAATGFVVALTLVANLVAFVALASMVGLALFAIRPVVHSWTMDLTPDGTSGSAISLLFAAQSAFTAVVPIVGGVVADLWGLAAVFHMVTGICVVATAMLLLAPGERSGAEAIRS